MWLRREPHMIIAIKAHAMTHRGSQGSVSPALERPKHYYRAIGRPTVDPELMLRMLWAPRPRSDHLHPKVPTLAKVMQRSCEV